MSKYEFNSTKELLGFLRSMKRVLDYQAAEKQEKNLTNAKNVSMSVGTELVSGEHAVDKEQALDDPYSQDRFDSSIELDRSDFRYYPKSQTYRLFGKKYKEGSLVALYVDDYIFLVNFDPGESKHDSVYTPLVVDYLDRKLPRNEADRFYRAAYNYAKRRPDPCAVAICKDGKLLLPCSAFKNDRTGELEYLAVIFNAKPCEYFSRKMVGVLETQVGNMAERLPIAYEKGAEINWPAFIADRVVQNQAEDDTFELYTDSLKYLRT